MNLNYISQRFPKIWVPKQKVLTHDELWATEYELCKRYPLYWMSRWLYTMDESCGEKRRFPTLGYIQKIDDIINEYQYNIILKARRMIMTWYGCAWILHEAQFFDYKQCMIQQLNARNVELLLMKKRIQFLIKNQPSFLFRGFQMKPKRDMQSMLITFPWDSCILGVPDSDEGLQLVGYTVSRYYCDEAAIQPNLEKSWAGAKAALSGGGKVLFTSSVRAGAYLLDMSGIHGAQDNRHSSMTGIEEWDNPDNSFHVTRLHYSANPAKNPDTPDGAKWLEEERKGYTDDRHWNREMEIDDRAMGDSLVYPMFSYDVHYLKDLTIEQIPKHWTRYFAIDPGVDAPTAAIWAAVAPGGAVFVYDEYYQRGGTIEEHAKAILAKEKEHPGEPYVRYMDPHGFKKSYTGSTAANEYALHGIYCSPANNDLEIGINAVKSYLVGSTYDDTYPMRVYFLHLPNLFKEIRKYIMKDEESDKPKKGNDHTLDALRYILVSSPMYMNTNIENEWKEYRDSLTGAMFYYKKDEVIDPWKL